MEKENYSEIIVEAMRLADKFASNQKNSFVGQEEYIKLWESVFNELANKAIEFSKNVNKKN